MQTKLMQTNISWIGAGLALVLAGCSNDVDPRVIPGGGVGDGEIDGEVNVHIIDEATDAPIANATVAIDGVEHTTSAQGLAVFGDVSGKQTIAVKVSGYRSTVWVGANGANVTIPLSATTSTVPPQATLSGSITGWDTITVPAQHAKAAIVVYSQSDRLGDDGNDLTTPANGNICFGPQSCDWQIVTRTGPVTLLAAIIDRDSKGTPAADDDTNTVIGWAYRAGIDVQDGVGQTGLALDLVEAGNLENVTIDLGTPPAALTETGALVGIEISDDEVANFPLFLLADQTQLLATKPAVFGATATGYRLTAIAQTASGEDGAQSIVIRRGGTEPALAAGTWLVPPTGIAMTRIDAAFTPSDGGRIHSVTWRDVNGNDLLEITILDSSTTVDVPALVALPPSGVLSGRASSIGADIDPTDFSIEDDRRAIWGIAAQPATVP